MIAAILFSIAAQSGATTPDLDLLIERFKKREARASAELAAVGELAVPPLLALLSNPNEDPTTRFLTANVLGDIGSADAVEGLIAALADPNPAVRRCSALALGWIGDARARAPLASLAENDPASWKDENTGEMVPLVREDARSALANLDRCENDLADASKMPPLAIACELRRLPWPFPGKFREQNLFNNYCQPLDSYLHAGLDLLNEAGTEVLAVEDGWVRLIDTNYPDWKTHHSFVVTRTKDGSQGFSYTHVDPDTYRFRVGDRVKQGQVIGRLVDFTVGGKPGVDHLHLEYVDLAPDGSGRLVPTDVGDPLLFFDAQDDFAPVIEEAIHFLRDGTLHEFERDARGHIAVRGRVDVIAGFSDRGWSGQSCNWGVPVITLEVRGKNTTPWRKLVSDLRGPVGDPRTVGSLYIASQDAERFGTSFVVHWAVLTNTDGDGQLEADDRRFAWNTKVRTADGKARFPDGEYEVIVRAWDLGGNAAERRCRVVVANGK